MSLGDIGSWASIVGLVLTFLTFILAARVNSKVNDKLKTKNDKTYFIKKVKNTLRELHEVKEFAEEGNEELLFSTKQYSKINSAIELVISSWDVLLLYEKKVSKTLKKWSWNKKFKRIRYQYSRECCYKNRKEIVEFLNEFITFLEKEQSNCG